MPKESFFHYFSEPREDDEEEEDEEEEAEAKIGFDVETDYDIGHTIRVSVIPEAVFWFTGENGDDDEDGDFGEEDEEEDDDEEEESEESEEEAPKNTRAKGNGKKANKGNKSGNQLSGDAATGFAMNGGQPPAGGADNPECKQN